MATAVLVSGHAPSASAELSGRGGGVCSRYGEPPGVGGIGSGFVDALRGQVGGRYLSVYPVNYPASSDFGNPDFAATFIDGIRDASSHIESMAANCPKTREVLGGFSQGAAVAGYVTSSAVPSGVPAASVPRPMAPDVASHVAAVTLFGTPSNQFLEHYGAPAIASVRCIRARPCSCALPVTRSAAPAATAPLTVPYAVNGMTSQAASYVSSHL